MNALGLRGIRGGTGTSSTVAALGYALHALGHKVLLVDMCPENSLGLHFNLELNLRDGWARATLDGQPWQQTAWTLKPGLCLLPYGAVNTHELACIEQQLLNQPELWRTRQAALAQTFDWILFDLPQRLPGHAENPLCDLAVCILNADPACHVLLQSPLKPEQLLLINRYDPGSQLQRDLALIWQHRYVRRLVPINLHADEAMGEALASRQPVGRYAPGSLIHQDIISFASWCLMRCRRST